jgi:hypothetical protein
MSTPDSVPRNFAGEPTDPTRDMVLIAARGLAAGTLTGTGLLPLFLLLGLRFRTGATSGPGVAEGAAFPLIVGGLFASMFLGGLVAWRLLAPVGSHFRRGVLAMIAAFATFIGAIVTVPIHFHFGTAGLLAITGLCLGGATALVVAAARRPVPRL